jgi:hypothetical protein
VNRLVRVAVPLSVAALLALTALAAAFSAVELSEVDPLEVAPPSRAPAGPAIGPPSALPTSPPEEGTSLEWIGDVVVLAWLAAAVAGLVLVLRALARRRGRRGAPMRVRALRRAGAAAGAGDSDEAPLLAALDAGLMALSDDDRDPRRAVIACWVRLEEAAVAAGIPRLDTDTAGDLVVRLLRTRGGGAGGGSKVSEPVLSGFAGMYRMARYATHTVDEQMRTQARTALRRLREELAEPAPVSGAVR